MDILDFIRIEKRFDFINKKKRLGGILVMVCVLFGVWWYIIDGGKYSWYFCVFEGKVFFFEWVNMFNNFVVMFIFMFVDMFFFRMCVV